MVVQSAIKYRGRIYTGRRHPDIIRDLTNRGFKTPISGIQGFLDDRGNFLDRVEARQHFLDCGQVSVCGADKMHARLLFSEDLY